ncbi:oligopeptide transport ATP-binding protein AppD [Pullulanibacillus camelliae]|uniref:Oligopeptide transport ATP-binding protein AppD n=1 Tax=Pullulanibacillus camelliae TaxID=1707096 RepID=A0A8J3DVH1_9BACL|nr:ABC transporter ATP-binding protein [Pullulanibacillus camelliae]GGE44906.1 oligopeptide transport ATP-binding protein AppD [Pullulanibacillus camelliae]
MPNQNLLKVSGLKTYFYTEPQIIPAVDGVDLTIKKGEILGLVGESGSGKSVTSLSIMRLFHNTPGKIVDGSITFEEKDLLSQSERAMQSIRGNEIAMIYQEPMTSLNPVLTIGEQIEEAIIKHLGYSRKQATAHAKKMLELVGIPRVDSIIHDYPHQLSGGMRQRVMIAMAMSCSPKLLIADEPTTALDVTIQAQILDLMKTLQTTHDLSILLITHDLGVIAEVCDRVAVMYAGRIVEEADVFELFEHPKHPYTQGLMQSMPRLGEHQERLSSIKGQIPAPQEWPKGCKFATRCPFAFEKCWQNEPELILANPHGHRSRCWLSDEVKETEGVKP